MQRRANNSLYGALSIKGTVHTISCGSMRIDRLSEGGLDPLSSGPVFDALQPGLQHHVDSVKAEVAPDVYEDRDHWDASLKGHWLETLARVVLRIRDMRHGGAILITPPAPVTGLDVKYKIEYPRLPEALCRWGIATIEKTHAGDLIGYELDADEPAIEAGHYLNESVAASETEDVESEIDGTLWFIACLSRVDGLVLMGPDLSVYGFGAVITLEDPPTSIRAARDDTGNPARPTLLSYEEFGTRHRSMMRFCSSYPGSVGFVVSQDGDVRAMTRVGDDLVVWNNVRLQRILRDHPASEDELIDSP